MVVVMIIAVMVVMMVMIIAVMMVVVMVMVVILRDLFSALRLPRGGPRVIYLQRIQRIGNWFQKVAITGRCVLCGCGNSGLCAAHCRQRGRSAQKRGDLLIHLFSSWWPQPKTHDLLVTIIK
jgi:hypothetical protein